MRLGDKIRAAFAVYGAIVGVLLGTTVVIAFLVVEDAILDHFLNSATQRIRDSSEPPRSETLPLGLELYTDDAPAEVRELPPGRHEIAQFRHVSVFESRTTGERMYLVLDGSQAGFDVLLGRILLATLIVIVAIVVAGIVFSRLVTRRLVKPLLTLVGRLDAIDAGRPVVEPLQQDDEIGLLSRRLAHAMRQVHEHGRRERDFTRYASHELRSPITVLRGTQAILEAETGLSERGTRAVERAAVATTRMARLIETLLSLARGSEPVNRSQVSAERVRRLVLELTSQGRAGRDAVEVDVEVVAGSFATNIGLLTVLLDNLLTNAVQHGEGRVRVRVAPPEIAIDNRVARESAPGHGFGLEICERVCDRIDFEMTRERRDDRYTVRLVDRAVARDTVRAAEAAEAAEPG